MNKKLKVIKYGEVASTNDVAKSLAKKSAGEQIAVIAVCQTQGRGRGSNVWYSPLGGLYVSFLLWPQKEHNLSLLALALALAAVDTLRQKGAFAFLKWPNDVMLEEKKIGGVLLEKGCNEKEQLFVVCGLGLNVNTQAKDLPPQATSLKAQANKDYSLDEMFSQIQQRFFSLYGFWQEGNGDIIVKKAEAASSTLGRHIETEYQGKTIRGFALAFDKSGALIVQGEQGQKFFLHSAQVRHLR